MSKIIIFFMALISLNAFSDVERIEFNTSRFWQGLQPCEKAKTEVYRVLAYETEVACSRIGGVIKKGAIYGLNCNKIALLQCTCSASVWADCEIEN